jgi:hypothetical protein
VLPRLEPRVDRFLAEPNSAAEANVGETAGPNFAIHPVGSHPEVAGNVIGLEQPRRRLNSALRETPVCVLRRLRHRSPPSEKRRLGSGAADVDLAADARRVSYTQLNCGAPQQGPR